MLPDPKSAGTPAAEPTSADERHTIAVVGGKAKIVRKAHALGLSVVHIQHPDEYDRSHWPYVDQALLVDYADTERILPMMRAFHQVFPFRAALSLWELGLLPAAKINRALGLDGNSLETVELLLDKSRMRRHLNAVGVSPVAAEVGRSERDMREFIRVNGLPIIVKPIDEAGSIGIFAVHDASDVARVVARFRALSTEIEKKDLAGDLDSFLMEEYLDGPEISVETLSFDGRHVLIGTTDKSSTATGFIETGHSQPSRHPSPLLGEVEDLVRKFLDAVGLQHGPAHTEVKLTARGPVIIESHNRVGGDRINDLTELAYGIDMEQYALASPFGLMEPLRESPRPVGGAAIRFLTPPPGRVIDVTGVEAVADDPALFDLVVSVEPGDEIPPLSWSENRAGHVIAKGATSDDAIANCERLLAAVRIHVEPIV